MAKRKLSTFKFEEELMGHLQKANLNTVEDVLNQSFLQLMTCLHLSAPETENFITEISSACLPLCCTAFDLLERETKNSVVVFGDPKLDLILKGGIKRGTLAEFTGPAGVGKTQMCLHLAVKCLHSRGPQNGVCCIDTEGAFRSERILEIIQHSDECIENVEELLSKFHVFQPNTISALNEILTSMEVFCIENDVGVFIVDSIASLARKEFSQASNFDRAATLASWAAQLKRLADQLGVAVIVTNQITSRLVQDELSDKEDEAISKDMEFKSHVVCPALGNTWTHFVNSRFVLQFHTSDEKQLIIAKSPVAPVAVKNYRITRKGIEFAENISYTFNGADLSKIRINAQPVL